MTFRDYDCVDPFCHLRGYHHLHRRYYMEESSLKRFGIAAGKTIREYLNCSAEFLEGIAEGMGDVTELTARLSKAMESPLPACTCGRAPMGSTRCNVCQHDLGCARHNASPCKIP